MSKTFKQIQKWNKAKLKQQFACFHYCLVMDQMFPTENEAKKQQQINITVKEKKQPLLFSEMHIATWPKH